MKRNIILNLITLAVTSFLLVLIVLAWYVSNSTVRASGITVSTNDDDYTLVLERGEFLYSKDISKNVNYNENHGWYWDWKESKDMTFDDIQPSDGFFFRIKMTTDAVYDFDVSFSQIKSQLIEGMLDGYYNENLVNYVLYTGEYDSTKTYYTGVFKEAIVTVGDVVREYTYYEAITGGYKVTTDTVFSGAKTYYKAKFSKANITEFEDGVSYYLKNVPEEIKPNAIGYKYDSENNKYDYKYTLDHDNKVKIKDKNGDIKTIYSYDSKEDIVSLVDFKIEDVFRVHDIGVYPEEFTKTDMLYEYELDEIDQTTETFSTTKTYYYDDEYNSNGLVKLEGNSFDKNVTYYTLGDRGDPYYTNSQLKSSKYSFSSEKDAPGGITYYYFALEFNESDSIENIDGVESSNCYLYQKLFIRELKVEKTEK